MDLGDYMDESSFAAHHRALARRVAELRAAAGGKSPAVAVWPEYVATFLMLTGHADEVGRCSTVSELLRHITHRHLASLTRVMLRHRLRRPASAAMIMFAARAHEIYVRTFGAIARDFDLWVVAGSGLFPINALDLCSERLVARSGELYNTSYTFAPTGKVASATRKVNLVPSQEDVLGLTGARPGDLAVVDAPFGKLGTLICYDGFHQPHTLSEPGWTRCAPVLDEQGVVVIAQPSANAWGWDDPWVFNKPGQSMPRSTQWFSEGLARELVELRSVRFVVNAQLVGSVLDTHFEAPSVILARGPQGVRALAVSEDPRGEDVLHARVQLPLHCGR